MSDERRRAFLMQGTRTGKLATMRRDGRPHVVPIWFVLDGDDLLLTTGRDSVKARAMRRDPRVSLCVDDEMPPYAFCRVDGVVELSDDVDEMLEWATRIGARYMGEERAQEIGRRNAVPEEVLVRLRPQRTVAFDGIAD
jgi:hypothetical protein